MPLRPWARYTSFGCFAAHLQLNCNRIIARPIAKLSRCPPYATRASPKTVRRAVPYNHDGARNVNGPYKTVQLDADPDSVLKIEHDTQHSTPPSETPDERDSQLAQYVDLLQRGNRLYGSEFVGNTWQQIKKQKTDLPVDGPVADQLWRLLCGVPALHAEIFDYACELRYRRGEVYDALYEVIMAQAIAHGPTAMRSWHEKFQKEYWMPADCLARIARLVIRSNDLMQAWKQCYHDSEPKYHCTYDTMVGTLMQKGMQGVGSHIHKFLIEHGDAPSKRFMEKWYGPSFQHVRLAMLRDNDKLNFSKLTKKRMGKSDSAEQKARSRSQALSERGSTDRRSVVEDLDNGAENPFALFASTQPQGLSDDFTARLFATRAFSVDTIIKGLSIFGSPVIGPLSLRQICYRLDCDPAMVAERLDLISRFDIVLTDTAFTRLVNHFVDHSNGSMLMSLVKDVLDPSVFEDQQSLQVLLADSPSVPGERTDIRGMLIVANKILFPSDPTPTSEPIPGREGADSLIKRLALDQNHTALLSIIRKMQTRNIEVTSYNLRDIWRGFFTKRVPGKRPMLFPRKQALRMKHKGAVEHAVLVNTFLTIAKFGNAVPVWRWEQLLKMSGLADSFPNTAQLCHQIVTSYTLKPQTSGSLPFANRNSDDLVYQQGTDGPVRQVQRQELMQIFTPAAQLALVKWGFRAGVKRIFEARAHAVRPPTNIHQALQPCLQGLRLLRDLSGANVYVYPATVRKAVKQVIWQAFGPGISSRPHNRLMVTLFRELAQGNRSEMLEILLRAVEETWSGRKPLFPELWTAPGGHEGQNSHSHPPNVDASEAGGAGGSSTTTAPGLLDGHPRRKDLTSLPKPFLLTKDMRASRCKFLMYSLFGETPRIGGVRNLRSRNAGVKTRLLSRAEWSSWVDAWATGRELESRFLSMAAGPSTADDNPWS